MEASAIHAPAALSRFPLGAAAAAPALRRAAASRCSASGNDEAFRVLHDRYRQRLFAYVRQMLSAGSRQDAEDVLQDVFVRAYGALRNDNREMNVRAWLYRVAHNRCIDHLRRPVPPAAEIFEVSRKPLHDPVEEAQRRDDLRRLVADVGRLPEQQRSALLMREIDGMTYADLADALDVTVPAVKSLLVRARVGLVEAAEARDADCAEIRADLLRAYDRGVKASGRARKHMRACDGCREYRGALRGMRRSFAALTPVGVGPLAFAAKLLGLGGAARRRRRGRRAAAARPRWPAAAWRRRRPARSPRSSARRRSRPAARSRSTTRSRATTRRRRRTPAQARQAGAHAPRSRRPSPPRAGRGARRSRRARGAARRAAPAPQRPARRSRPATAARRPRRADRPPTPAAAGRAATTSRPADADPQPAPQAAPAAPDARRPRRAARRRRAAPRAGAPRRAARRRRRRRPRRSRRARAAAAAAGAAPSAADRAAGGRRAPRRAG